MTGPRVITVSGLDVTVLVRPRRRTVGLTVERDGSITAAVPAGVGDDALAGVISRKAQWLHGKVRERDELGYQHPPRQFAAGEGFLYLGYSYRLQLVGSGAPVRLNKTTRRLEMREDCTGDGARHLKAWYRQQGLGFLPQRIAPWAQRMEAEDHALRVLDLGYHWGSCSPAKRTVNMHWAVMQMNMALIDYVLVHELAHLRYPRHDDAFWHRVGMFLPLYREDRKRLRKEGLALWLPEQASRPGGVG